MEVTEVRIKLTEDNDDRLRAFCSLTFDDCFVVRDIKIIEGGSGPFIAMPSRKLMFHCGSCGFKNHLRSRYCNQCGKQQPPVSQQEATAESKTRLYADIAHPINSQCREKIQTKVIQEFQKEVELSKEPGYKSRYDDEFSVGAAKKTRRSGNHTPRPHHLNKPGSPSGTGNPVPSGLNQSASPVKTESPDQFGESIRRTGAPSKGLQSYVSANAKDSISAGAMKVPTTK